MTASFMERAATDPAKPGDNPLIALAGAPNVGKSTLFNALTGSHVTVGNWPGTSVDCVSGQWPLACGTATVVDLPGAYSLDAMSADEQLTADVLLSGPDVAVIVADGAHLARSLYLVSQLREHGTRLVIALTMADVAARRGIGIDADALGERIGAPVVRVDPRHRAGLDGLGDAVTASLTRPAPAPRQLSIVDDGDDLAAEDERFGWVEAAVAAAMDQRGARRATFSDRADRWVVGRVSGPVIFLLAMWFVFQVTTTVAAPLQEMLTRFFAGPVSAGASALLRVVHLGGTWVQGLVVNGLIAGVGTVLAFLPLMIIMFVLLSLLEDSGYMARAAVVTDTLMRRLGLPGQAFLPLVVGFGCNVPGIAATRILPDARQRRLTALLVPFTSCSARLTVYMLVSTVFFGRWAGTAVFAMYVLSILLVVGVGWLMRRTLWDTWPSPPLVLDLPPYQRPTLRLVAATAWQRVKGFLVTASGIIVSVVVVVWVLQAIPAGPGLGGFGNVGLGDSLFAVLARAVAPLFAWAGFGSWQLVAPLIVGLVAKEAVISSWAQIFTGADLTGSLHGAFAAASGGHATAAAAAFLVFVLAYTPCAATISALRHEIGGRWTSFGVAVQLALAWVLAVIVFQIGVLL